MMSVGPGASEKIDNSLARLEQTLLPGQGGDTLDTLDGIDWVRKVEGDHTPVERHAPHEGGVVREAERRRGVSLF